MQLKPIVLNSLDDIEAVFKKLKSIKLLEICHKKNNPLIYIRQSSLPNDEKFTEQFLVSNDGNTYLLSDILQLSDHEAKNATVIFITKDGQKKSVVDIKKAWPNDIHLYIQNLPLANALRTLQYSKRFAKLRLTLPECPLAKTQFPVIKPVITHSGITYEEHLLKDWCATQEKASLSCVATKSPLYVDRIFANKTLEQLIWLNLSLNSEHVSSAQQNIKRQFLHNQVKKASLIKAKNNLQKALEEDFETIKKNAIGLVLELAKHTKHNDEQEEELFKIATQFSGAILKLNTIDDLRNALSPLIDKLDNFLAKNEKAKVLSLDNIKACVGEGGETLAQQYKDTLFARKNYLSVQKASIEALKSTVDSILQKNPSLKGKNVYELEKIKQAYTTRAMVLRQVGLVLGTALVMGLFVLTVVGCPPLGIALGIPMLAILAAAIVGSLGSIFIGAYSIIKLDRFVLGKVNRHTKDIETIATYTKAPVDMKQIQEYETQIKEVDEDLKRITKLESLNKKDTLSSTKDLPEKTKPKKHLNFMSNLFFGCMTHKKKPKCENTDSPLAPSFKS